MSYFFLKMSRFFEKERKLGRMRIRRTTPARSLWKKRFYFIETHLGLLGAGKFGGLGFFCEKMLT